MSKLTPVREIVLEILDCLDKGTDGSGYLDSKKVQAILEARNKEIVSLVKEMKGVYSAKDVQDAVVTALSESNTPA